MIKTDIHFLLTRTDFLHHWSSVYRNDIRIHFFLRMEIVCLLVYSLSSVINIP